MAKTDFTSVDEYIAAQPDDVQSVLERVRRCIRKALPGAEEVISYQIPAYRVDGRLVIYFAGWKEHFSLYPVSSRILATLESDPAAYTVSKSTIRFPLAKPVPAKLIGQIAKSLAQHAVTRRRR